MSDDWTLADDEDLVVTGTTLSGRSFAADVSFELLKTEGRPNWAEVLQRGELRYTALKFPMLIAGLACEPVALCQVKKFYAAAQILAEQTGTAPPPPADEDIVGPSAEAIARLGELDITGPQSLELTGPDCKVWMVFKGPDTDLTALDDHQRMHLHLLVCVYAWLLLAAFDEPGFVDNVPVMVSVGLSLYEEVTTALHLARSGGAVLVPLDAILDMLGVLDEPDMDQVPGEGGVHIREGLPPRGWRWV